MAKKIIKARLKQRTDTQANWAANNPVLLEGELGLVTDDKNLYKVGDGVTAWNDLPFRGFDGTLVHETGDSDNAAMSQRGVTRALAKLEENMANNEKIKELSGKIEQLAEENTRLKERIEEQDVFIEDLEYHKLTANSDNRYPDISVGTADNLAGVDVVDSEINFRRSGGGAISDGVARIETIKGNSVVWNQKISNALDTTGENGWWLRGSTQAAIDGNKIEITSGTTLTMITQKVGFIADHQYLIACGFDAITDLAVSFQLIQSGDFNGNTQKTIGNITSKNDQFAKFYTASGNMPYLAVYHQKNLNAGDKTILTAIKVIDLTQMFGSGNEPTTIDEFYQRIPMGVDLNAYNEGEVIHMDVQSIESVGVNQWDEEWELGKIENGTGEPLPSSGDIRSKNYIPVIAGATYYCLGLFQIIYYDEKFKQVDWWSVGGARTLTMPNNVHYVKLYKTVTTSYNHDVCINLSDTSVNGKYYPHIKRVEDLSIIRKYFPQGMKSAGSAHDEIRRNKTTQKREKVQRIGEIDFSGAKAYTAVENTFFLPIADMKAPTNNAERGTGLLCAKYPMHGGVDSYNVAGMSDKSMLRMSNGNIYIKDSAFGSDITAFKAAMAGVILYYELAEPIITELDKEDQLKDWDYSVWNDGTERANAEGKSSAFAADLTYGFNAVGKIKELEGLVAQLRAKVGI